MDIVYIGNELAYIKLDDFILESYSGKNQNHLVLLEKLINSKDSNLISENIGQYIINTKEAKKRDYISDVYVIGYKEDLIGLTFVNYTLDTENIELKFGLIDDYKNMNLEQLIEKELSEKLLEIYPRFKTIKSEEYNYGK